MSNTDRDIRSLASEAATAGDLTQWALCARALDELEDCEPGTDGAVVLATYTVEQAREACEEALEEAADVRVSDCDWYTDGGAL